MKTCIKKKKIGGFSIIEVVISIAIFAQIMVMIGGVVMNALEFNSFNKSIKRVNTELYTTMVNGIGAYIRSATGIMYENDPKIEEIKNRNSSLNIGTIVHKGTLEDASERICDEEEKNKFDQLTLYQDKEKQRFITFGVEKDEAKKTSRLVWCKGEEDCYYLNSEDTYITCFLVSPSINPYQENADKFAKSIQPYVQLFIAGRHRFEHDKIEKSNIISYKSTFTLRNYYY